MKKIGVVARQEDVSVRTIIRLEKAGAIRVKRDRNGARVFDEEDIKRLRAVLYPEPMGAAR
jgi:DNA-binding transcriptional MerR regulator